VSAKKRTAQNDEDTGSGARKGKRKAVEIPKRSGIRSMSDDDDSGFEILEDEDAGLGYDDRVVAGDVGQINSNLRPSKPNSSSVDPLGKRVVISIDDDDDDDFM